MGCGFSTDGSTKREEGDMAKSEKANMRRDSKKNRSAHLRKDSRRAAIKAALLIQGWYRRYMARLEARRRCTWSIFQSLEYAGEQDQLRLYNFFTDMMTHLNITPNSPGGHTMINALSYNPRATTVVDNIEEEDAELMKLTNPSEVKVGSSYKGPRLRFPLTMNQVEQLIEAFKKKQVLHGRYVLELLHEVRKLLKRQPNIIQASTSISKRMTICGDLHGKLDDLFIILYKNGLPAVDNPYIFNGDFVDRGANSVEIAVLLFAFMLCNPNEMYVNRGNHEDHVMNLRYGFIKEVMNKYKMRQTPSSEGNALWWGLRRILAICQHASDSFTKPEENQVFGKDQATKVVRLFEEVFSWLPLATIIDQKVLVTHGGVSDKTDLEYLATIDRHKYLSALRPPVLEDDSDDDVAEDKIDLKEWRQILDILWSDPKPQLGCKPNTFRGGGCYFGPDVTERILDKHHLQLLIRSHECKPEGYEFMHNNKCLTIFSASNYYEIGSNKGAYIKMGSDLQPHLVQYMASKGHAGSKLTSKQRVGLVEESAMRSLKEKIYAHKSALLAQFEKYDTNNTGQIRVCEWCAGIATVIEMDLPWRSLLTRLVKSTNDNMVEYQSTFEEFVIENILDEGSSSVTETLYRNKDTLETIFRAIDKDNSGLISLEEFEDACALLGKHAKTSISKEQVHNMVRAIDQNKDGHIDFNEFLEAFRIVNNVGGGRSEGQS